MKNRTLSVILGTLTVIAAAFFATFLSGVIAYAVLHALIKGSESFIILSVPSAAVFSVYFVLFEVLFFKWQFKLSFKEENQDKLALSDDDKKKNALIGRISRIVTLCVICISIAFPFAYSSIHVRFDGEKIVKQTVFVSKEYTTENVNGYSLLCDSSGMRFTISMKDGESFELFNSDSVVSDEFEERYESIFGYAAHLSDIYDSQERIIRKRVSGREKMESTYSSRPNVWKYLSDIIAE